jgi:hypothetical protein
MALDFVAVPRSFRFRMLTPDLFLSARFLFNRVLGISRS